MYHFLYLISDAVGIFGVVLMLIGFFGISTGRISSDSLYYQSSNFIGAWLVLYSLYFHWNLSSVVIEIAWVIISMIGIYRLLMKKVRKQHESTL